MRKIMTWSLIESQGSNGRYTIQQVLFSPNAKFFLISSRLAHIFGPSTSRLHGPITFDPVNPIRWAEHPSRHELVLGFDTEEVHVFSWIISRKWAVLDLGTLSHSKGMYPPGPWWARNGAIIFIGCYSTRHSHIFGSDQNSYNKQLH